MKACSFFGHRDTVQTEALACELSTRIEGLIADGVGVFLFGSRSKFDELCHQVVTKLQEKYPHIRRIVYLCRSEAACLVGEGARVKECMLAVAGVDEYVGEYEEIKRSDKINSAGKASYVERNEWMIDESDVVFVCMKDGKNYRSGTRIAYEYAVKRKKQIEMI